MMRTIQRQGNLQKKLLILLTVSVVLPLTAATISNLRFSGRALTNIIKVEMEMAGQNSAEKIQLSLNSIQADVRYLSQLPAIQALLNIEAGAESELDAASQVSEERWLGQIQSGFESFIQSNPDYDQLRYIDETGQEVVRVDLIDGVVTVIPQSELQDKSGSTYFQEAIALPPGELYVSQINLNRENGKIQRPLKPVIRYASPVYDQTGQVRGILVANIRIADLFADSTNTALDQTLNKDFIVINQEGYYLFHPDPDKAWGFEFDQDERLQNDLPETVAQQILTGDSGTTDSQRMDSFLSYQIVSPHPERDDSSFILIYRTPKAVVLQPLYQMRNFSIVIVIISLGIMLPVGILWLRRIVRSLLQMTSTVTNFSDQMTTTIAQQEDMVRQQASSVQETTATIDQLSHSSRQSAEQADAAAIGANQVIQQVNRGQTQIEKTLAELKQAQTEMLASSDKVDQLTAQVQRIGLVSSLISELAQQTNMLAINSSIEAVQAGERGQGFGVVAREIRKLADESRRSSEQIKELVAGIYRATEAVSEANRRGQINVDQSREAMQQTAAIFGEIATAVEDVVVGSQQIALNSQEQAQAIGQVTEAMTRLNQVARESADGIRLTQVGTQQLQTATTELERIM